MPDVFWKKKTKIEPADLVSPTKRLFAGADGGAPCGAGAVSG